MIYYEDEVENHLNHPRNAVDWEEFNFCWLCDEGEAVYLYNGTPVCRVCHQDLKDKTAPVDDHKKWHSCFHNNISFPGDVDMCRFCHEIPANYTYPEERHIDANLLQMIHNYLIGEIKISDLERLHSHYSKAYAKAWGEHYAIVLLSGPKPRKLRIVK